MSSSSTELQGTSTQDHQDTRLLYASQLLIMFFIGAFMLDPTLFKVAKPTGEIRQSWFQIITTFLLCLVEDNHPCLYGLYSHRCAPIMINDKPQKFDHS